MGTTLYARTSHADDLLSQVRQANAAGFHIDHVFEDSNQFLPPLDDPLGYAGGALLSQLKAGDTLVVRWPDVFGPRECATRVIEEFTKRGVSVRTVLFNFAFDDNSNRISDPERRKAFDRAWRFISMLRAPRA